MLPLPRKHPMCTQSAPPGCVLRIRRSRVSAIALPLGITVRCAAWPHGRQRAPLSSRDCPAAPCSCATRTTATTRTTPLSARRCTWGAQCWASWSASSRTRASCRCALFCFSGVSAAVHRCASCQISADTQRLTPLPLTERSPAVLQGRVEGGASSRAEGSVCTLRSAPRSRKHSRGKCAGGRLQVAGAGQDGAAGAGDHPRQRPHLLRHHQARLHGAGAGPRCTCGTPHVSQLCVCFPSSGSLYASDTATIKPGCMAQARAPICVLSVQCCVHGASA